MTSAADYVQQSLPIVISPNEPNCASDCQLWFDCQNDEWNRCDGQGGWSPISGGVGSGLHADLTDLAASGHPGTVITIPGGVQDNAVSIAADGSLQDSGIPPGGVGGTTNLGHILRVAEIEITSSSGQNTIIAAATAAQIGFATAAQIAQLEATDAAGTARPPTAHAATHGTGQADELTPAAIAAATAAQGALADSAVQPGDPLVVLSSGAAADGQVPEADGAGNIVWRTPGGSGLHADLTDLATSGHPGTVITIPGGIQDNAVSIAADGSLQDSGVPPGGGGGSGLHADLTDLAMSGHPGTVITIGGGVQGNAVSIAADGSLQDSGVPPGGAGGTTDLGNVPTATNVEITSSSGQNTTVAGATNAVAGVATAAQIAQLEATDAAGTARPPTAHAAAHGVGQADELTPAAIGAEPAFAKNTAFNKDFGASAGLVCEGNDARLSDARTPTAHAATHGVGQVDELTPAAIGALANVIDDTDPYVGGDLKVGGPAGFVVAFTDVLGVEQGSVGYTETPEAGVYLAYAPQGTYHPADGGILAIPGQVQAHGAAFSVLSIQHSDDGGQQVYCTSEGVLYSVEPPPPGWSDEATDAGSYDLGTGTGLGAWVQMTGTLVSVQADVAAGNRLEIQGYATAVNKTGNRSGVIEIGFGLDDAQPVGSGDSYSIAAGFSGSLPASTWSWSTHGGLLTGQTISLWGRRVSGDHGSFGVDLDGAADNHVLEIFVHRSGGGGSPTNIAISYTPTTVAVESSTGTNGTIVAAVPGGNAGILSGVDKTKLDASWADGATVVDWGLGVQDLGTISSNTQVDLDLGHHIVGTMSGGDWEIDFVSSAGHPVAQWTATIDVAGQSPVWRYAGALIDLADGYDISGGLSRYKFSFERDSLGVDVSERGIQ